MPLPIIPHESFGADCCGCLVEVIGATTEYRCNECAAVIPPEDVHRVVLEIPTVDASCPHCGRANEIAGFSEIHAFICKYCGLGTGDESTIVFDQAEILITCPHCRKLNNMGFAKVSAFVCRHCGLGVEP